MSTPETETTDHRWPLAKWPVLGLLSYWGLYALLAPVTIYDAHVYNVARLFIIRQGGFFGNHVWNEFGQISYPWGFDAVHYPFTWLGAGFDLPSFACLLGVLIVVHRLVGNRYGAAKAWYCDLALLAMPTLVYQATSTKNDLAGVFGVAIWFYALGLWNERRERAYLFWMALALAFTAGTKLSGPPLVAFLSLYSLWRVRGLPRRQILEFVGALAVAFLVVGSAETYLNNLLLFKSPFGPPERINFHRNIDGVAGGVANFIRYFFGTMNVGIDAANPRSPVPAWLADAGRGTLRFVGLNNVGYRRDYNDATFSVLKMGLEAASDYGPVGALALITALCLVVTRLPGDPLWKLSAAGLATLVQTCLTVGWMPWNNRFLLLPFVLFGVAFTLYSLRDGPRFQTRRALLFVLLLFSAVVYPLHSYNRKPADLLMALTQRETLGLSERPAMGEIVRDLQARVRAGEHAPLLLTAGEDSWTYDILKISHLNVLPTPTLTRAALTAAVAKTKAPRLLILLLNRPLDPGLLQELRPLNVYAEAQTTLYEWTSGDGAAASATPPPLIASLTDGWYGAETTPDGSFRWMGPVGHLNVAAARDGTLTVQAHVRSIVPGNTVDLLVDDQPVATATLPGTEWQDCLLHAPLSRGVHRVALRSRLPGVQPPGDDRVLTICVMNLQTRLEP